MKKIVFYIFFALLFFTSCKKMTDVSTNLNKQLYPLAPGNKWIYVDSFFNEAGVYYGKDTFTIKTTKTITYNNQVYTPVTDQFDDSIFILRSDDSTVFILEHPGEALMFKLPVNNSQPFITSLYNGNTYSSVINTQQYTTTNFPSYKILITQDDGQWFNFKQLELFFTIGLGIIKGRDIRKNRAGKEYAYDSYKLISFSLY